MAILDSRLCLESQRNEVFERDVKYRFVIDMASLKS
jgi:hypothetical protein